MKRSLILTAFSFLVLAQLGLAQVPQTFNYQGVLKDNDGNIVADDNYDLAFRLYDDTDTQAWEETHSAVGSNPVWVENGTFSVILGEVEPLPDPFPSPAKLGIKVGADAEMTPRIELTAVPYSLQAGSVSGTDNVFPGSGSVGIGTTTPLGFTKLHIYDAAQASLMIEGEGDAWNYSQLVIGSGADGKTWALQHGKAAGIENYLQITEYDGANYSPRLVIQPGGNVGIGTTSPFDMLDVTGNIRINDGDIFFRGGTDIAHGLGWYGDGTRPFGGVEVGGPVLYGSTGGGLGTSSGTQNVALYWNQAGDVGIGTTTPENTLHVKGWFKLEGSDFIMADPAKGNGGRALVHAGSGSGTDDQLQLNHQGDFEQGVSVEGPQLMVAGNLIANGNVGIGTASPEANLQVVGNWILGPSGTPPGGFDSWLSGGSGILYEGGGADFAHHFSAYGGGDIARFGMSPGAGQAPDSRVVIANSGNVGIGTADPSAKLEVVGVVKADSILLTTAAERWVSIPGVGFHNHWGGYRDSSYCIYHTDWGNIREFYAPLNLPHGATIVQIEAAIKDTGANNMTIRLVSVDFAYGTESSLAWDSSVRSGVDSLIIILTPSHVVDNQRNIYLVKAAWKAPYYNSPTWEYNDVALRGVRIKYTVNQPLP